MTKRDIAITAATATTTLPAVLIPMFLILPNLDPVIRPVAWLAWLLLLVPTISLATAGLLLLFRVITPRHGLRVPAH